MTRKPPVTVDLEWDGDLRFRARTGDVHLVVDSDGVAGPSPMQAAATALAGCMCVDIVLVLQKGRRAIRSLRANVRGSRAETTPARFTSLSLHVDVVGDVHRSHVARAVQLSRDKYCSVWHSLRRDISLDVTFSVNGDAGSTPPRPEDNGAGARTRGAR